MRVVVPAHVPGAADSTFSVAWLAPLPCNSNPPVPPYWPTVTVALAERSLVYGPMRRLPLLVSVPATVRLDPPSLE